MEMHSEANDLVADGLTTVAEAADFLSVGRSTVYDLMERGELAYVKLGRCRRIPRKALLSLAASNIKGGWNAAAAHNSELGAVP